MKDRKLILVSANRHAEPYPVYPLGISYLSSFLTREMPDLKISIFDFLRGSYDDYSRLLEELKPDYAGISLRNIDDVNIYKKESFINHYRKIIGLTRSCSDARIIVGGSGFSIYPKLLFETLKPDFGIYGEGEESLRQLIVKLENSEDPGNIGGLVYRKDGVVLVNRRGKLLPMPVLEFDGALADHYWQESGMLNIQTKRGCPYNCIYCTYPLIEGHRVRTLDPGQIVKTLTDLYTNRKIDYVFFTDSIFNISNSFNYELADRLIAAGLDIRWGGYFNFTNIDRQLLEKMKQSGLKHIEFGTDTISDALLEKYRKPFKVEDIMRISAYCTELDIDFAHFLILGGYGETDETLAETFENSKKITRTVFFPFIGMRIYPGTRLHEIAVEEKIVGADDPVLEPVYYVSKHIDLNTLKPRAHNTGKAWIFPDDDLGDVMKKMRLRNKKGPLWEYLVR
ncbi:MAG: radical SAM protein [Bacteroidales bacterium]|nr:radical SAM protein [Bacteroidales bacterium]